MDSTTQQKDHRWDVIIVGAGWQGIAAAKTYLDIHPDINLLILDSNQTLGGVWALQNQHANLHTQNTLGTFEYTWYPLRGHEFGVEDGAHIPGKVVYEYLSRAAREFHIVERVRLNTTVVSARKAPEGGWLLEIEDVLLGMPLGNNEAGACLRCRKLVVATGITSSPRESDIAGRDSFGGTFLLYADLLRGRSREVFEDPAVSSVTVIGASKGSYDAVSWAIDAGKSVSWIIQKSGYGPAWMTPPALSVLGFHPQFETLPTRRAFSLFSPCIWADDGAYPRLRWFLHKTTVGRLLVDTVWSLISKVVLKSLKILRDDLLVNLKPKCGIQWQASSTGTLNYTGNFYRALKAGNVSIYRQDIESIMKHGIQLGNGTELHTDAIIHVTGWLWKCPFDFAGISTLEHGVPTASNCSLETKQWYLECQKMKKQIRICYPYLQKAPIQPSTSQETSRGSHTSGSEYTPWCLYRCIAPPCQVRTDGKRDLVFLGFFNTFPKVLLAEIQSLWAVAYLEGQITVNDEQSKIMQEARMWCCWSDLRYPFGHGSKYPDTAFDIISYFDVLLKDLGLKTRRKNGWMKELCSPYGVSDYRAIVEEFKKTRGIG